MFGGDTAIQSQRDTVIQTGGGVKFAVVCLLWITLFSAGFLSGFFVWHYHAKDDIRDMVCYEVDRRLRDVKSF
jgi:hypothetical protein